MIDDGGHGPGPDPDPEYPFGLTPHPDIAQLLKATAELTEAQHATQRVYHEVADAFTTGQRMTLVLAFTVFAYVPTTLAATFLPLPWFVRPLLWLVAVGCVASALAVAIRLRRTRLRLNTLFAEVPPADGGQHGA